MPQAASLHGIVAAVFGVVSSVAPAVAQIPATERPLRPAAWAATAESLQSWRGDLPLDVCRWRRLVILTLQDDAARGDYRAVVQPGCAPQVAADSIAVLIDALIPSLWKDPQVFSTRTFAVALDRTASGWGRAVRLDPVVRQVLARGRLQRWVALQKECVPEFSLDKFVSTGAGAMPFHPVDGADIRASAQSDPRHGSRRDRFGMLAFSPGGEWVLDPFIGMEVDSTGRLGADVDTGWSLYDPRTGDRYAYWVGGTESWVGFGEWTDSDRFVLVGSAALSVPPPFRVDRVYSPMMIVGDVRRGTVTSFTAAPLQPPAARCVTKRLHALWAEIYPGLRFP